MAEENQATEQSTVEGDSGQQTQEEPGQELILGRFKTPDELANAYRELEGKFTQTAQEKAEYERSLQELKVRQQFAIPQQQAPTQPQADDNELFWKSPVEVINRVVMKAFEPLATNQYEAQKERFRSDPDFVRYESQIDAISQQYPQLKTTPGIVGNLYKMVRGLNFDEAEFERRVREKVAAEQRAKVQGSVEGGGASREAGQEPRIRLTEDEKRIAIKYYPELSTEDAIKRYADNKRKAGM
jgi:hypothetical protein